MPKMVKYYRKYWTCRSWQSR